MKTTVTFVLIFFLFFISGCFTEPEKEKNSSPKELSAIDKKLLQYASVKLNSPLTELTVNEKKIISLLIDAADLIDDIYWLQFSGDKKLLMDKIKDESAKKYALINYGPWDQLQNNEPFIDSYGKKLQGANFYPADMTKEEFEKFDHPEKKNPYGLIIRNTEQRWKKFLQY